MGAGSGREGSTVSAIGAITRPPRVSVLIPAYNHARFLPEALSGVLAQSFRDCEVLVVDDGSTDSTREVVANFAPQVRYLHQENAGQSRARNMGIRHTTGEYVAFLDADDRWYPGKIAAQVAYLDAHPDVGVVFTKFLVTDEAGQPLYLYPHAFRYYASAFEKLLVWPYGSMNTAMVRRACLEKIGLFDENLTGAEDWDLWLRLAPHYGFGYIDGVLATYRQSAGSQSRGRMAQVAPEMFRRVLDKLFANPGRLTERGGRETVRLRRRAYASLEVTIALNMAARPWPHLLRAIRLDPGILAIRWRALGLLLLRPVLGDRFVYRADAMMRGLVRPPGVGRL